MEDNGANLLFLSQEDVLECGVLNMDKAMSRISSAFSAFDQGDCIQPDKTVLRWSDDPEIENTRGRVNFLSAYVGGEISSLGMKWIGSYPTNREKGISRATALVVINDDKTGMPLAVMEGTIISAVRTAAVIGTAVKHLAPKTHNRLGIIGSGVLARALLMAITTALPDLKEVTLYNRTRENAERFKNEMKQVCQVEINIMDSAEEAIVGSDIGLVITSGHDQLMRGEWMAPGMLSIQLAGNECDYEVIRRADKIVCDHWEGLKHRGIMTPAIMYNNGEFRDDDVYADLGEIINGIKHGRENEDEHIHFCSMGMGICDVALGSLIYETALESGVGKKLELWSKPLWV